MPGGLRSKQQIVNISIEIYDNIICARCCCGSNFHYSPLEIENQHRNWLESKHWEILLRLDSVNISKGGEIPVSGEERSVAALWQFESDLMNVWDKWLGGGDIFIRLRLTGPNDEKNIAAFALRERERGNILQSLVRPRSEETEERRFIYMSSGVFIGKRICWECWY